jgi:hypothetical protein
LSGVFVRFSCHFTSPRRPTTEGEDPALMEVKPALSEKDGRVLKVLWLDFSKQFIRNLMGSNCLIIESALSLVLSNLEQRFSRAF